MPRATKEDLVLETSLALFATHGYHAVGVDRIKEASGVAKMTLYKQLLRVLANTILDIRLQTMNMTDRQALDLMIKDTYQEKEEATAKLQRAQLSSCQLPMYFAGWKGWLEAREL